MNSFNNINKKRTSENSCQIYDDRLLLMSCAVKMVNCGQSFFYSMKNNCVPSKLCNRMKSVRDLTLFFPKNCALTLYLSSQNCFIFHKRTFSFPLQTLLNILFLIDFLKTILMLLESGFFTFCFF